MTGSKTVAGHLESVAQVLPQKERESWFYQQWPFYAHTLETLLRHKPPPARGLDAGASPGHFLVAASLLGYQMEGLDILPDAPFIHDAEGLLHQRFEVPMHQCNMLEEPFPVPSDSFDFVTFTEVLEHLNTWPLRPIQEMARVLKPGGILILSTPNVTKLQNRLKFLAGKNIYTSVETMISLSVHKRHSREYTLQEVVTLVERAGLRPIEKSWENLSINITDLGDGKFLPYIKITNLEQFLKFPFKALCKVIPSFATDVVVVAQKG